MLKKITALVLAALMIASLAACGKKEGTKTLDIKSDKKVAVLVAPEDEFGEDYRAAKELAEAYPDNVVLREYSDSRLLKAGDSEIITLSEEIAKDKSIGAIIYARATQFTYEAIVRAKTGNPAILAVAIEPEDDLEKIASVADFVIKCDRAAAAKDIVAKAKEAGAQYFVFFSNEYLNRLSQTETERKAFENECKEQKIKFIADNGVSALNGTSDGSGIEKAKNVAKERLAYLKNNKMIEGENVALFSADVTVQSTLAALAADNKMIYVSPEFPSALDEATLKLASESAGARFFSYKFGLMTSFVKAAFAASIAILDKAEGSDNLAKTVKDALTAQANDEKFAIAAQTGYENVFAAYCPAFEKV
ncbi:MAG: DUF3798 domain-containing protein [Clostridia bacterium]|nr:DUF3798 domain-containing protein [Clostridia bacterium]